MLLLMIRLLGICFNIQYITLVDLVGKVLCLNKKYAIWNSFVWMDWEGKKKKFAFTVDWTTLIQGHENFNYQHSKIKTTTKKKERESSDPAKYFYN